MFLPPASSPTKGLAVFFAGDAVATHALPPRHRHLIALSTLAPRLFGRLPHGFGLLMVQPPAFAPGGYACYAGLLPRLTPTGEPVLPYDGSHFSASTRLRSLLEAVVPKASWPHPPPAFPPIHLLGFSKGGVVLNQLLTELAQLQAQSGSARCCLCTAAEEAPSSVGGAAPQPAALPFLAAICSLHYLDVGLNAPGTYCTDPWVFEQLARRCEKHALSITLHGTPRQWDDPRRPWIAEEAAGMATAAKAAGVCLRQREYLTGEPPSLAMHFRILELAELGLALPPM